MPDVKDMLALVNIIDADLQHNTWGERSKAFDRPSQSHVLNPTDNEFHFLHDQAEGKKQPKQARGESGCIPDLARLSPGKYGKSPVLALKSQVEVLILFVSGLYYCASTNLRPTF